MEEIDRAVQVVLSDRFIRLTSETSRDASLKASLVTARQRLVRNPVWVDTEEVTVTSPGLWNGLKRYIPFMEQDTETVAWNVSVNHLCPHPWVDSVDEHLDWLTRLPLEPESREDAND